MEELAAERRGRLTLAKVNADEQPRLATEHAILGLPTLLLFKDGKLVDRLVGAAPKARLAAWVDKHATA